MNGQLSFFPEEDEKKYADFVDKFKPKKTTDDCYTPPRVYDAVADWVAENYELDRKRFIRPFYPGGDYTNEVYDNETVVVDNPPFSILSQIVDFYTRRGVRYFLFAPALTLFSGENSNRCYLPIGVSITYENGAVVGTSFITNLEDLQVHAYPELYRRVEEANNQIKKKLPQYTYPDEIVTAANVQKWCKYGIEYRLDRKDCVKVGALDAQKRSGKTIYGGGFILSEKAVAEKAVAEKAVAEKAVAEKAAAERKIKWVLSEREMGIVKSLGRGFAR